MTCRSGLATQRPNITTTAVIIKTAATSAPMVTPRMVRLIFRDDSRKTKPASAERSASARSLDSISSEPRNSTVAPSGTGREATVAVGCSSAAGRLVPPAWATRGMAGEGLGAGEAAPPTWATRGDFASSVLDGVAATTGAGAGEPGKGCEVIVPPAVFRFTICTPESSAGGLAALDD